uniref:Heat shock transcription factor 2 binding protein n=1 Tax=Lates calcarifer TaxID=8187 RepID=A0A4W6CS40_LATCA
MTPRVNCDIICVLMEQGKLQSFLTVAGQTLESFVRSLDSEVKTQTEDHNSQEHQFVLALAGTITNIAAVTSGRNFLSSEAHILLDTLVKLLELMKPGVFPKLKVLMLMALYNVSISVKGLKYIIENPGLMPLIWTLLNDGDWEVCLHSLRLLQSVLLEEEVLLPLGSSLLDPDLQARVSQLTSSVKPSLRQAAQQTLEDLQALQQ